jgi:transcriptional antiterminator RfaH
MNGAEHSWYAVATKPRQEGLVCKVFDLFSIKYFLPKILVPKSPSIPGSSDSAVKPMFPGYLFVNADPDSAEWARVNYSPGVKGVVSFGGIPARVPHEVVSGLRERTMRDGTPDVSRPFTEGDMVVIRKGPLKGLAAIFKGYVSDSGRVKLLMELLRRCTEVEARVDEIEKIEWGGQGC